MRRFSVTILSLLLLAGLALPALAQFDNPDSTDRYQEDLKRQKLGPALGAVEELDRRMFCRCGRGHGVSFSPQATILGHRAGLGVPRAGADRMGGPAAVGRHAASRKGRPTCANLQST